MGANIPGVVGESQFMRVGKSGVHNACYIQGISCVTTGGAAVACLVDANGQLSTISSSEKVKQNIRDVKVWASCTNWKSRILNILLLRKETGWPWGDITLSKSFVLPLPAVVITSWHSFRRRTVRFEERFDGSKVDICMLEACSLWTCSAAQNFSVTLSDVYYAKTRLKLLEGPVATCNEACWMFSFPSCSFTSSIMLAGSFWARSVFSGRTQCKSPAFSNWAVFQRKQCHARDGSKTVLTICGMRMRKSNRDDEKCR